jgi:hypothetical protein
MVAAEERIIAEATDAAKNFDSLFSEEAEALRAVMLVMPVEDLDLVDPDDVGVLKAAVLEIDKRATIEESFILILIRVVIG